MGYSLWGHNVVDTTKQLMHTHTRIHMHILYIIYIYLAAPGLISCGMWD